MHQLFNIQHLYVLPTLIYVFCIYLRTNGDFCHLQYKLIGFYNRDEKCLLRGMNWVFKKSSLRFIFKGLIHLLCTGHSTKQLWVLRPMYWPSHVIYCLLFGRLKRNPIFLTYWMSWEIQLVCYIQFIEMRNKAGRTSTVSSIWYIWLSYIRPIIDWRQRTGFRRENLEGEGWVELVHKYFDIM